MKKKSACGYKVLRTPGFDPMHPACEWHDEAYLYNKNRGGEELREQIDYAFYYRMLRIAENSKPWKRPFLKAQAWLYYKLVKEFGSIAWNDKSNAR